MDWEMLPELWVQSSGFMMEWVHWLISMVLMPERNEAVEPWGHKWHLSMYSWYFNNIFSFQSLGDNALNRLHKLRLIFAEERIAWDKLLVWLVDLFSVWVDEWVSMLKDLLFHWVEWVFVFKDWLHRWSKEFVHVWVEEFLSKWVLVEDGWKVSWDEWGVWSEFSLWVDWEVMFKHLLFHWGGQVLVVWEASVWVERFLEVWVFLPD